MAETGAHTNQDRSRVELWFTKAFFEAFNWWGWYLKFPFCDQLLAEWGRIQPADDRLLSILQRFYRAYPEGLFKHGKEGWQIVRESLYSLRFHLNIEGDDPDEELPEDDEDARFVRAISDWFIAQACRFGPEVEYDTAEEHYLTALRLFESIEDEWNIIWTYSYMADLYLETRQFDQASSNAQQSIQIAQKGKRPSQQDHEVLSQNYRILGDIYWQQKDLNQALRDYARSIYHAYLFQAVPEPPDRYSLTLYQDTRKYVIGVLIKLWQQKQQDEALAACQYLHNFWSLYWGKFGSPVVDSTLLLTESRFPELDAYLFPAEPRENQLGQKGEYMDNIAELATRMSKKVKTAEPAVIVLKS
jgi:tetratricopeptide (TPR) repeat protein